MWGSSGPLTTPARTPLLLVCGCLIGHLPQPQRPPTAYSPDTFQSTLPGLFSPCSRGPRLENAAWEGLPRKAAGPLSAPSLQAGSPLSFLLPLGIYLRLLPWLPLFSLGPLLTLCSLSDVAFVTLLPCWGLCSVFALEPPLYSGIQCCWRLAVATGLSRPLPPSVFVSHSSCHRISLAAKAVRRAVG